MKALENAQKIDPGETATFFQLGRARMELKQWDEAIAAFKEGIAMDPNHLHTDGALPLGAGAPSRRAAGRGAAGACNNTRPASEAGGPPGSTATFERSKFTQARVPFKLEQPDKEGVKIKFVDATKETLGDGAQNFSGPIGVIDVNHTGWNSLFVVEKGQGLPLALEYQWHVPSLRARLTRPFRVRTIPRCWWAISRTTASMTSSCSGTKEAICSNSGPMGWRWMSPT